MHALSKYRTDRFKTAEPILKRSAVFLIGFVIASGIIGPRIISHHLIEHDGFEIYGSAGKSLLFGIIMFLILTWRKRTFPKLVDMRKEDSLWFVLALVAILFEWHIITLIIGNIHPSLLLQVLAHATILTMVLSLLCFSFGLANLRILSRFYKNELILTIVSSVVFISFLNLVYDLWDPLAKIVLLSVQGLLHLIGLQALYIAPHTLVLSKFGITLIQACSGVDSIALFTALYILFGILDWQRFNHTKYLGIFIPAIIVLIGFNILRVFTLITAGYYINPQIAFSLFHTYAGMVFFIIYSSIFWAVSYKWMLQKSRIHI